MVAEVIFVEMAEVGPGAYSVQPLALLSSLVAGGLVLVEVVVVSLTVWMNIFIQTND
jgi:hypothetical protein